MRLLVLVAGLFLAAWLLHGCVPQSNSQLQQPVSIAVAPPDMPPPPPSTVDLEKPPNIVLEKSFRDPFVSLKGGKTILASTDNKGKKSSGYNVSGVIVDRTKSAILESGTNSFIIHPGDKVQGYVVSSISPKQVILTSGRTRLVLPISGSKH